VSSACREKLASRGEHSLFHSVAGALRSLSPRSRQPLYQLWLTIFA